MVTITEDTMRNALLMPKGNQSPLIRNSAQEINNTFMLMGESNYTFKDLIQGVVELALRLYTQCFTHGKVVRYMNSHRRLATMFTKALTSKYRLSLNFSELILIN